MPERPAPQRAGSRHRLFVGGGQFALRFGPHWMGVRSSRMRELWSERNRIGWRIVYLPFGMRAFYRKDVPLRYPVEPSRDKQQECSECLGTGRLCECDRGERTPLNCWACTNDPCPQCVGTGRV